MIGCGARDDAGPNVCGHATSPRAIRANRFGDGSYTAPVPELPREIHDLTKSVTHRLEALEESRSLGVPVATTRRFFEIEGLDLGGLLALELFTTVIPLILIGFGWASNFNDKLSFGDLLIKQLHLHGAKAEQMHDLFSTGASLKSTWTVVGLGSFLVWGIPMSSQVAKMFGRAFRRQRYPFWGEVWRGTMWFVFCSWGKPVR